MTRNLFRVAAVMLAMLVATAAATAQPRALGSPFELLMSYVGDWRGESVLQGGDTPEAFRCRLTITRGTETKINYAGRCTLVRMNLSVAGTIAFNTEAQRFEAVMSSNVGFTGSAVGRIQGERITFDLIEQQSDRAGNEMRIGAAILLEAGVIAVDFEVEFNDSGEILTALVPFSR